MPRFAITILILAAAAYTYATIAHRLVTRRRPRRTIPKRPPVVLIIMDEFPVDQMLNRTGRIDPVRYPNFAALAATGTWFKNAYTTYDSTTRAVPEVMDGRAAQQAQRCRTTSGHPDSIFTLLGPARLHGRQVRGGDLGLPAALLPRRRPGRPAILPRLQRGRRERLERFFATIKPGPPTLYLKHILLPARAVPVPALGQADPPHVPRPAARHERPRRLR